MRAATTSTVRRVAGAVVVCAVAAGCGTAGGAPLPTPGGASLQGASIVVGSKDFDEQRLLGQIAILALEHAGADVEDRTALGGNQDVRAALLDGDIDLAWEYTGTAWVVHLKHEAGDAPTDGAELADKVRVDDAENGVVWLEPAEADNGYAIAASSARAEELEVTRLSELGALIESDPADATLCAAREFVERGDGWAGVEEEYDFDLPDADIVETAPDEVYGELVAADTCSFGEVFGTDGRIVRDDLVIIEDTLGVFVKYNPAVTIREDVYTEYGAALEAVLDPITELLTSDRLRELNAQVEIDGQDPAVVAAAFLEENGLLD